MGEVRRLRAYQRNPLSDWIRENLTNTEYGACKSLTLVYEKRGTEEEVQTVTFTSQQWTPEQLSDRLYTIAKEHCKDDQGVQHRFKLCAFYGDDTEPRITKRFSITPYGEDGSIHLEDSPDAKGALAQGMRLTEKLVQGTFTLLSQMTGSAAAELADLRTKNMQMFDQMMGLMVKVADVDHERRMAELKFQRDTEERKQWMSYAPILINTILNKEVFPQSMVDTNILEAAAEHLSTEDLQALSTKLPPHLWGPLAARMEKFLKDKRLKQEENAKVLELSEGTTEFDDDK